MFDLIAFTDRTACASEADFFTQIGRIAGSGVSSIILREKDVQEHEYEAFAKKIVSVCGDKASCTLHHFAAAAKRIGVCRLHLSLSDFESNPHVRRDFSVIGVSVHSKEQAMRAQELGADYVCAGHVFETDCKKGVPARGIAFLTEVCEAVAIPVYAIGGIGADNISAVRDAGAYGACLMSAFMTGDPEALVAHLRENVN